MSHRIAEAHPKPVRKTRARRRAPRPDVDWLDRLDALDNHCWHLDTLTELLQACGGALSREVVASAGYLLNREVKAVRALLAAVRKGAR